MSPRRPAAARITWPVFLALLALVAWLSAARAQAATVLIVRPAAPSPAAAETLSRLHGELLAVGLAVEVATQPDAARSGGTNPRAWLEKLATERALDAALEILDGPPQPAVDVWIFSGERGREEVTNVVAEPGAANAVERLAIRSVDVLRSILVESRLNGAAARQPPPPGTVARAETTDPQTPRGRVGLALGAALLSSFDGGATAVAPLIRLEWAPRTLLALQLEAAGLGSRPEIATQAGSARVSQQYLLVGLCACAPAPRRLRPTFALSAGALHTSADGSAQPPAQGHTVAQWSLLLQATVGARLVFLDRYELSLAAHAQLAQPYVAVYVGDTAAATLGRPTFALTLTLGGWR